MYLVLCGHWPCCLPSCQAERQSPWASSNSISTKFYCKYVGHEGIQAVTVFGDLSKFNNFMAL